MCSHLGSADDDGPAVRKAEMMGPDSRLQVNPTCRLPNTRYSTPTIMETCAYTPCHSDRQSTWGAVAFGGLDALTCCAHSIQAWKHAPVLQLCYRPPVGLGLGADLDSR